MTSVEYNDFDDEPQKVRELSYEDCELQLKKRLVTMEATYGH